MCKSVSKTLILTVNCEFLTSDSDFAEGDSGVQVNKTNSKERTPKYDRSVTEDDWVGRRVVKNFDRWACEHDEFEGIIVYGVDEDTDNKDYRLFLVHYFDDPEDPESMWSTDLMKQVITFMKQLLF